MRIIPENIEQIEKLYDDEEYVVAKVVFRDSLYDVLHLFILVIDIPCFYQLHEKSCFVTFPDLKAIGMFDREIIELIEYILSKIGY